MNTTNQPFWKDEPNASFPMFKKSTSKPYYMYISRAIRLIILIVGIYLLSSTPLAMWLWILFYGVPQTIATYLIFKTTASFQNPDEIQRIARERTGASQIGSAIHIAGHPLLQRDQAVVLALVNDQLNIYSYDNSTPLDSIILKNIQSIHTVVYDDDRVPHIDAVDSAAQALQLSFLWSERPCTCLFRRMRKLKPIDWYHAIQQVRLQSGLVK